MISMSILGKEGKQCNEVESLQRRINRLDGLSIIAPKETVKTASGVGYKDRTKKSHSFVEN